MNEEGPRSHHDFAGLRLDGTERGGGTPTVLTGVNAVSTPYFFFCDFAFMSHGSGSHGASSASRSRAASVRASS